VALVIRDLADVYRAQGRFRRALELQQRALRILERTVGRNDPRYRESLAGYARLLRQSQRPREAAGVEATVNALR
jgi:tetratricopeptide (TPR) repeat protein